MKFALAKEHRDYFEAHQVLELEGLLSAQQLSDTLAAVDQVLATRQETFRSSNLFEQQYMQGRDLWRSHPVLQKLVRHERFIDIAAELTHQKTLRLGYDQYLGRSGDPSSLATSKPYDHQFLVDKQPLSTGNCIQGLVCGLILCIDGECEQTASKENSETTFDLFPKKAGHAVFFSAKVPIDFNWLNCHQQQRFLLITYAQLNSVYIFQDKDPHAHTLKSLGYSFGDRLLDRLHPVSHRHIAVH